MKPLSEHSLPIAIASEEEWRVTMRYADEHEAEYPPSCHCDNGRFCEAEHPVSHYGCTEPYGHTGPHIACGPEGHHHFTEWPNEFSPPKAPRSDFGEFLLDMAHDMNRVMTEQVRREPQ